MSGSPLVIVYHRQPLEEVMIDGQIHYRTNKSPNGIVPTLKSFFNHLGDEAGSWVAWKTFDPEVGVDFEKVVTVEDPFGDYRVSRLPLTKEQVESFYHVTSKEALWPILHSFPEKYDYDPVDWSQFREVNWLFAEAAAFAVAVPVSSTVRYTSEPPSGTHPSSTSNSKIAKSIPLTSLTLSACTPYGLLVPSTVALMVSPDDAASFQTINMSPFLALKLLALAPVSKSTHAPVAAPSADASAGYVPTPSTIVIVAMLLALLVSLYIE